MSNSPFQLTVISGKPEETISIGRIIGENLDTADIVALTGELGAGKTCLAQGIARGLGVSERYEITSPTFTLINEYQGRRILYHLDLYRLKVFQEMEDIGYEEYLFGPGVSVIEWAEKVRHLLPAETIFISFTYLGETQREIVISGNYDRMQQISKALKDGGY